MFTGRFSNFGYCPCCWFFEIVSFLRRNVIFVWSIFSPKAVFPIYNFRKRWYLSSQRHRALFAVETSHFSYWNNRKRYIFKSKARKSHKQIWTINQPLFYLKEAFMDQKNCQAVWRRHPPNHQGCRLTLHFCLPWHLDGSHYVGKSRLLKFSRIDRHHGCQNVWQENQLLPSTSKNMTPQKIRLSSRWFLEIMSVKEYFARAVLRGYSSMLIYRKVSSAPAP